MVIYLLKSMRLQQFLHMHFYILNCIFNKIGDLGWMKNKIWKDEIVLK